MKALVLLLCLIVVTGALPIQLVAQAPDHAERARPSISEKRRKSYRPYLMTGRPVANPYFMNSAATIEPPNQSQPQNESSIAVNPLRPHILLASAVDYRPGAWAYISTDRGASWRNVSFGDVRTGWPSGNDPSVGFDHLGNGYVMYGAIVSGQRDSTLNGRSGIYVAKTTDDGATWQKHIAVIEHQAPRTKDSALEDKYYIEIDRSTASPYRGWMYTPWKRVIDRDSSTQIMFARSTDGGLTWGAPVAVSPRKSGNSLDTTFGQSFPLAACGPEGTVHVVWNDGPARSIGYARSTDGGATFSEPRFVVAGYPTLGTGKKVGNDVYHVLKGTFRAETYPTLMVDNSTSARRGWLYLAWAAGLQPDIYFSRSTDGGATWSAPRVIHSDTTNDQWWPWLSIDPLNGDIAVMFSDSRNDPNNILIDQYVAYSPDGGDTWIDRRATDFMSDFRENPFEKGIFAGDYSGNAFYDGRIYPSFLDTRTDDGRKDNDVYIASLNVRQPYPVNDFRAVVNPDRLTELTLHWTPPTDLRSLFDQPLSGHTIVVRRDSAVVAELPVTATQLLEQGLEHGRVYRYRVAVAAGSDTSAERQLDVRAGGALEPAAPSLVAVRWLGDTAELDVRLPAFRADGSVPLADLGALMLYRDSALVRELPLATSDTGRVVTVRDVPGARGYYRYAVAASAGTEPRYQSARTAERVQYIGSLEPYALSFDDGDARLLMTGTWARTQERAVSQPSSLTDSPGEDYRPSRSTTVQLYPVEARHARNLMFAQIVIVDPSDSAIVEFRLNSDSLWRRLADYNWTHDARWSDSASAPGDWGGAFVEIPANAWTDTVWVRYRLRAGITRNGEGWYIDDVAMNVTSGVDAPAGAGGLRASVRPNPFVHVAIVEYTLPRASRVRVRVLDALGRVVRDADLGLRESGRGTWAIDGTGLSAGAYRYEIVSGDARIGGSLVRLSRR